MQMSKYISLLPVRNLSISLIQEAMIVAVADDNDDGIRAVAAVAISTVTTRSSSVVDIDRMGDRTIAFRLYGVT